MKPLYTTKENIPEGLIVTAEPIKIAKACQVLPLFSVIPD